MSRDHTTVAKQSRFSIKGRNLRCAISFQYVQQQAACLKMRQEMDYSGNKISEDYALMTFEWRES